MTTENPLNILSIGAGAIGTYVGGSLALHGHQLTFVEQPQVAKQLDLSGLRLDLHGVEHRATNVNIVGHLDDALQFGPFDLTLFALKSYHTKPALAGIAAFAGRLPPFLCLQNGIDNEPALAEVFGEENVIPATVTSAVGRRAAGDIILERLRGLGIADVHPLSSQLAKAFTSAGLNVRLYPHAAAMKWSKMLTNLIANASSAILDMTPAEVFAHPGLFALEIRQLRECLAVMRAQNIPVVDLPGTPVRALAFGVRYLPLAVLRPIMARMVGAGRGAKMPSFHIDLHAGSPHSEVDYLNGAVVRLGDQLGIPTPINRLLNTTLLALTGKETPLESFRHRPADLLAAQ